MAKKQKYRVQNWKEYNKALVNRGSLTVWFDASSIEEWYSTEKTSSRGRPTVYSDLAIECCLTLKTVFRLPLRATQGFVDSIAQLMGLPIKSPNYSLLSKRQKDMAVDIKQRNQTTSSDPKHIVVDSTGLKIYGEGEWKVRTHGKEKRRSWIKLHLAIDENSHSILSHVVTAPNVNDCQVFPELINQIGDPIDQVTGDGAYDTHDCYLHVINKDAKPCFPPRATAIKQEATDEAYRLRNHAISQIEHFSRDYWKRKNKYHRRSLAETAMYRFKQLVGDCIQARRLERQITEIAIKCKVINRMTALGMPVSIKV